MRVERERRRGPPQRLEQPAERWDEEVDCLVTGGGREAVTQHCVPWWPLHQGTH